MIKNDQVYLEHILKAIAKIENFTNGVSRVDLPLLKKLISKM
jgi:uncharacterized protein with HEPN domain